MSAQYLPVLFALLAAAGFVAVMLLLNKFLGPKPKHAPAMERPFECGSPMLQVDNRRRISVKFYLVALLFVMFDLETVLLYPWAVLHRELGEDKYRPCPLLRRMVAAGHLGRKSGKGFYDYQG